MLILVFLLFMTSLPKVWLKPITVDNSALTSTSKNEELRTKRQATFFDILHQAIEKYANCADEHLAPLKALANYKPYETLTAERYSPNNQQPIVAASPTNPNKSNVKCTTVNLCSIINQNSDKAFGAHNTYSKPIPYFPLNGSGKSKLPFNIGHSRQSQYHNPFNHCLLNLFLQNPIAKSHQQQLLRATGPDIGSTNTGNGKEIALNRNTTAEQYQYGSHQENGEQINDCPCLKSVSNQELIDTASLESDVLLGSSANKKAFLAESKEFEKNLNQLLMHLDEMADNASNEELRQILEKLKNLKSAFDVSKDEDLSTTATSVPYMVGAQNTESPHLNESPKEFSFSNLALNVGLLEKIFNTNADTTAFKNYTSSRDNSFESQADVKSAFLELNGGPYGTQLESVTSSYASEFLSEEDSSGLISKDSLKDVTKTYDLSYPQANEMNAIKKDYIVGITGSPALQLKISNYHDLKQRTDEMHALKSHMEKDYFSEDHVEALTRSPVLQLKQRNTKNLAFSNNESDDFESSHESEDLEDYYDDSYHEAKTKPAVSSKETKGPKANYPTDSNKNIHTNLKNEKSILDKHLNSNSSKLGKKDSKITISITSNGKFKHIKVEQHEPDEKKLEINEKEQMNMGTHSSKGRPMDMVGTGSKYVKVVKPPIKKDTYTEPILSEIYPAKTKFPLKEPLSIYWNKIEEQPSKVKKEPNNIWHTFQSGPVFNDGNSNEENHKNISKEGIDYDGTLDGDGSDSKLT